MIDASVYLMTAFLSLLPISELRGAIPYAVLEGGMPNLQAFFYCVFLNALVGPLVFIFLSSVHKLLVKWTFYKNLFDKIVDRTRHKMHEKIEKYGYLGITIFVAIPFPITGAYTGTLGAWLLGLDKGKTFLAVALGCLISGTIVSLFVYFGPEVFGSLYNLFTKQPAAAH